MKCSNEVTLRKVFKDPVYIVFSIHNKQESLKEKSSQFLPSFNEMNREHVSNPYTQVMSPLAYFYLVYPRDSYLLRTFLVV